jgi:ubiquinone/menaquinone biosynthesis C-methylase UbiE
MFEAADLSSEWAAFAPEWIARSEQHRDHAREGLLDDWMLQIIGEVAGLEVIDLGCGEGRFCRMLADRGAQTLGIDLQPAFVAYADRRKSDRERYTLGDMQNLDGVSSDSFDVAVSYITLVDVPYQRAAIGEAFRVLRPRGRFVVCTVSPMASAWISHGPWHVDESGANVHFVLDNYTIEGPRRVVWRSGHEITNFHRMLSTTINDFLDAGFVLRRVYEPMPNEEQLVRFPENQDLCRVPIFTIFDLEKPA